MDLFSAAAAPGPLAEPPEGPAPLAERLRPARLSEVIGQDHLLGPDGPLGRMLAGGKLASLILQGPPGVGKTTIARLLAREAGLSFETLSAVMAGLPDLRKVLEAARLRHAQGRATVLFVDEIHRWNKAQQDALLPDVERGSVVLIGATTENPGFSLVPALLSRAHVLTLARFDDAALETLLRRVEGVTGPMPLDPEARARLRAMADGDARFLINLAEQVAGAERTLSAADLAQRLQKRAPLHDRAGDAHYNLLSCFHKSLRASDVDAALYYAARMIEGGEAPEAVFRRLTCAASEDVGLADPHALPQVVAAWQAFERIGWPEGRLFLGQAVVYVATAPKSNAHHAAFDAALALARRGPSHPPPMHLLNAPTRLMKEQGYGRGYQYDHDCPDAFSGQPCLPEALQDDPAARFYTPTPRGFERELARREEWRARRRAERRKTQE